MPTFLSVTPSAFARIKHIAMNENVVPFELQNEILWHADMKNPESHPLEKLPMLILGDGGLKARQIQVLAEGYMDALALLFFETAREKLRPECTTRQ